MSGIPFYDENTEILHICPQCKRTLTRAPLCDVCTAACDGILAGTLERFRADSEKDAAPAREARQKARDDDFNKLVDDNAVPVDPETTPRSIPGIEPGGKKRA